jgi:hypothetical protein
MFTKEEIITIIEVNSNIEEEIIIILIIVIIILKIDYI